jgi:hypothetical protein
LSDDLEAWLTADGDKTLGSLFDAFGEKSFAVLFVLLLAVPALPLPTGGATHVFELVVVIVAAQLVLGREVVWLPRRWRGLDLAGGSKERFVSRLLRVIRWLERFSRPRARFLFGHRLTNVGFGLSIIALSAAAFVAPPFSGLDTLPSLGGVLVALGVLLEDGLIVIAGLVVGAAGATLELVLGKAAVGGIGKLVHLGGLAHRDTLAGVETA